MSGNDQEKQGPFETSTSDSQNGIQFSQEPGPDEQQENERIITETVGQVLSDFVLHHILTPNRPGNRLIRHPHDHPAFNFLRQRSSEFLLEAMKNVNKAAKKRKASVVHIWDGAKGIAATNRKLYNKLLRKSRKRRDPENRNPEDEDDIDQEEIDHFSKSMFPFKRGRKDDEDDYYDDEGCSGRGNPLAI